METIFSSGLFMRLIDRLVGESMTGNTGPLGHAHWIDHYVKVTHTSKRPQLHHYCLTLTMASKGNKPCNEFPR